MKTKLLNYLVTATILFVLFLSGCWEGNSQVPTIAPGENPTETRQTPTRISTSTNSPSPTSSTIPSPFWTPLPTFSTENSNEKLLDFLSGSEQCRLPCLMGITPGITSWEKALYLVNPITGIASIDYRTDQVCDIGSCNAIVFGTLEQGLAIDSALVFSLPDRITRRIWLRLSSPSPLARLKLADILTIYGPPDRILVDMNPNATYEPGSTLDGTYILLLAYPNYQFAIVYYRDAILQGENLVNCDPEKNMQLIILDNGDTFSTMDGINGLSETFHLYVSGWKRIETITKMTVNSFSDLYKNPNPPCITTSINVWK
jgi:hypothetical protein